MPERLVRRGDVFYFRAKFPAELRHQFKSADRWKSLGPSDRKQACLRVRAESFRFDAEMAERRKRISEPLRTELTAKEIDAIAAAYFHELMLEDEEHRAEGLSEREFFKKDEAHGILSPKVRADVARGNLALHQDEFDDWLQANGHRLDQDAPVYRAVLNRMLKEFARHLDATARRQEGEVIDTPPAPDPIKAGPTVRDLIDAYLADPGAKRNSKTLLSYRIVFDALAEIVGDSRRANDVSRADCESVRDTLLRLVAADVCKVLGLAKVDRATAPLGSDEKGTHPMSTPGGTQRLTTLPKSGLYQLVMRSNKPIAREFQDWVTHKMRPAIRKDGMFVAREEKVAAGEFEDPFRGPKREDVIGCRPATIWLPSWRPLPSARCSGPSGTPTHLS